MKLPFSSIAISFCASVLLVGCATTPGYNPNGAIAALNNLPGRYRHSATKVYADTAIPVPPSWNIIARNYNAEDKVYLVTTKNGFLHHETPAPDANARAAVKNPYPINRKQVLVDSDGAWAAGAKYSTSKGVTMTDAKMSLHQKDATSAPFWSIRCYDVSNNYIGTVVISASTGAIISS